MVSRTGESRKGIQMEANKKYQAWIDGGQGGTKKFVAANLEDAIADATEWARDGEWRMDGTVSVRVWSDDEDTTFDVAVTKSAVFE